MRCYCRDSHDDSVPPSLLPDSLETPDKFFMQQVKGRHTYGSMFTLQI